MITEKTIQGLRDKLKPLRDKSIALVPTMGNLHQGHLKLIEHARQSAEIVVVSIFINPLQFGPDEDLESYPKTLEEDINLLTQAGVDVLFAPSEAEMYRGGREDHVQVIVPELSQILCGVNRQIHFNGVATVVVKLLNIVQPDEAFFGEKDFQQLQVIKKCVRDLSLCVEIIGVETVREENGLALSSRNVYLTLEHRQKAPLLYQSIESIVQQLEKGERNFKELTKGAADHLNGQGFFVEYVEIRRQHDLALPCEDDDELVVLVAALLGAARLIDIKKVSVQFELEMQS